MKLHEHDDNSLEPCQHMESMLNRTADGTAPSWMRWYATAHAKGCPRCGRFLARVTSLLRNLKHLRSADPIVDTLSTSRWESIEERWTEVES